MDDSECTCKEEEIEPHSCPYALDVGNECELPEEEQTLCTCCGYCETNCAMDI